MNHLANLSNRLVLDAEASDQCFECAAIAVMGELHVHHIEWKHLAIRGNCRGENKLRSRIDESSNQPGRPYPIDFGTRPCQPSFAAIIFRFESRRRFFTRSLGSPLKHLDVLPPRALKKIDIADCPEL